MNKRIFWNNQDDEFLMQAFKKYGYKKWDEISKYLFIYHNIDRNPAQCRERYNFHLKPSLKKVLWTYENYILLIEKQNEFGNKWAKIKKFFPNFTESNIKNKFFGILRKSIRRINKLFGNKKCIIIRYKINN